MKYQTETGNVNRLDTSTQTSLLTATVFKNHVIPLGPVLVLLQEANDVQHIGLVALGVTGAEGDLGLLDLGDLR